jgi:hypothetical protein
MTQAVTLIPASGEFACATRGIRRRSGGRTTAENLNVRAEVADLVEALDRLQAMAPKVESVSLVVASFGDDLRAGACRIRPGVEVAAKTTSPAEWSVNGVERGDAHVVSTDAEGRPVYEPESKVHETQQYLASLRVMRRMLARSAHTVELSMLRSQSLARRRHRPSQAKVRSTTQRRGRASKPFATSDRLMISIVQSPWPLSAPRSLSPA